MKISDNLVKLLAPLTKNVWAYLIVIVLLVLAGYGITKLYIQSGGEVKVEKVMEIKE